MPQEVRDSYYDMSHPAIQKILKMDLPLYEEILDYLGIGGKNFLKTLGHGHKMVGIQDEPGIWRRKNKK